MMKTILLITLSLVTAMKTEQLDCSLEDLHQIRQCKWNLDVERYTCEDLEASLNCIESINGNCAALIWYESLDMSSTEIRSNEPCYHQKFDQYLNQDGQCSFEDIRQVYKSVVLVAASRNQRLRGPEDFCPMFQTIEDVIKQTKENCLGFYQDQASIYAHYSQMSRLSRPSAFPDPMPECLKAYLPNGDEGDDEDLPEEKPEFPTVNKLIQELVLIQKILSNKP